MSGRSFLWFFIICLAITPGMMISTVQAQEPGAIVVGVEPAMYAIVLAGVKGWNEAGVKFVVRPSGCGTGDVTFCYSSDPWSVGGDEQTVAWWPIGGDIIYVSTELRYPFGPPNVCHEIGHWLGLADHRSQNDGDSSCMADVGQTSASPDEIDLENLENLG